MGEDCCKGHDHKDCCNDKEDDGMSMSDIV